MKLKVYLITALLGLSMVVMSGSSMAQTELSQGEINKMLAQGVVSNRASIQALKDNSQVEGEMIGIICGYLYLISEDPDNAKYYFEKMNALMTFKYGLNIKKEFNKGALK